MMKSVPPNMDGGGSSRRPSSLSFSPFFGLCLRNYFSFFFFLSSCLFSSRCFRLRETERKRRGKRERESKGEKEKKPGKALLSSAKNTAKKYGREGLSSLFLLCCSIFIWAAYFHVLLWGKTSAFPPTAKKREKLQFFGICHRCTYFPPQKKTV